MTIWIAMLLGLVQGLCEFLPVSSSGHLLLLQKIFGVTEGAMFFTVMLHVATLVAVCIVYRKTIVKLIRQPFNKTVGLLILATIPAVVIALLFKKIAPLAAFADAAENGRYLGYSFLLTSVLLLASDRIRLKRTDGEGNERSYRGRKMRQMRVSDALIIGTMQGVAILPGVSRSGSTISGALFCGLSRKTAADFSFLMSIIAILGGAVLEIPDALESGIGGTHWTYIAAGMLVAGITGYFAVRLMLAAIKKKKLWGFAAYTAVLGVLVLIDQFATHTFF
jgi:undecaprenyl-diphosphatase